MNDEAPIFEVGDRVEIAVVCFMPPCIPPQGTVTDANVRVEDRPALYQGPGAKILIVPEGEPYQPARRVYSVKVREDGGFEWWHDVLGLRKIGSLTDGTERMVRSVQPFSGEEEVSPWGWLAVGAVVGGTMALGAWFATRPVDVYEADPQSFGPETVR